MAVLWDFIRFAAIYACIIGAAFSFVTARDRASHGTRDQVHKWMCIGGAALMLSAFIRAVFS